MRKLSVFVLTLALLFAVSGPVDAAATKASASRHGSNATPNITDASNGNTADVSNAGDLIVRPRGKTVVALVGGTGASTIGQTGNSKLERGLTTAAATIYSITFSGDTVADTVMFYDATTANGQPLFEIEVGTALSTVTIPLDAGAAFSTEVYVKFQGAGTADFLTVLYDLDTI